jgi:hypothetical protein
MIHTAEPMTLEKLRDDMEASSGFGVNLLSDSTIEDWIAVIDAELTKQREAEPVAWRYRFSGSNDWKYAGTGEGLVDPRPLIKSEPLYTHSQQRNTDEVTDTKQYPSEDHNCEYQNGDGKCFECTDLAALENCRSMIEKAVTNHCSGGDLYLSTLLAARNIITTLSAVASRDREDAGYYKWRLDEIIPIFEEARDALPAISEAARKLHGIDSALADRMDKAGYRTREEYRAARRESKP